MVFSPESIRSEYADHRSECSVVTVTHSSCPDARLGDLGVPIWRRSFLDHVICPLRSRRDRNSSLFAGPF